MSLENLKKELQSLSEAKQAANLMRFFKTGKGEYGEGDIFIGIKVPVQRNLVKKYWKLLKSRDVQELLNSKIHEHRLIGLLCLIQHYKHFPEKRPAIFDFYLKNIKNINNWDLVDLSAPNIVGDFLLDKDEKALEILYRMAKSGHLWTRRVAVLSTFAFIREKRFREAIKIGKMLLDDSHDLIHKAVGWMLREIGKRDEKVLLKFLDENYKKMPRTMLRYSIEKLNKKKKKFYMQKNSTSFKKEETASLL